MRKFRAVRWSGIKASLQSWLGTPIHLTDGDFWREWMGAGTFTGKRVTVDQTLQLSTAWACVRLISQTLATLPLGFYKRKADGSRDSATTHALYDILHNQPNADMTAIVFWEVVAASLLLRGNAYIEIMRSAGTIVALGFLDPSRMVLKRFYNGDYEYRYRETGGERVIAESNMMHIPAFSLDGIFGLSPVLYGANVFGTTVETDKASAETFQSAMRSSGLVTMDFMMSPEQREQVRKHVASVSKTGGVMVLEKGSDFKKLSFDPVSAQLLESRSFNVEEICRWFGLDPAMVGHGGKDSNWGTGLEQKMLWFLIFALRQWCVRIEQAIRKNLLTPVERMTYFAEFNMEGLLRGDSTSRAAFYASAAQNGWKSRNEIRRLENDPPVAGGDDLTVQSNLVPIALLGKQPQATAPQPAAAMQIQLTSFDASLKSVAESVLAMQKGQQQIAEVLDVFAKTQDGLQQSTALVADATKRSAEKLERATDEITSAVNQMAKPRRAVFDEDGDLKGSEVVDSLD